MRSTSNNNNNNNNPTKAIRKVRNKVRNIVGDEGNIMSVTRNLAFSHMIRSSYLSTEPQQVIDWHNSLSNTPPSRPREQIERLLNDDHLEMEVKLVVLDGSIEQNKLPILEQYPESDQIFTLGILIGTILLTWNKHDLIIPRRFVGNIPFSCLSSDLDPLDIRGSNETIQEISDLVCDWNINRSWKESSGSASDFILSILDHIGIQTSATIRNFIQCYGTECNFLVFYPSEECCKHIGCDPRLTFKDHYSLDEWVHQQGDVIKDFEEDWQTLKIIDRMLWARWVHEHPPNKQSYGMTNINQAVPTDKEYADLTSSGRFSMPSHNGEEFLCPFANPLLTGSVPWTES